MHVDGTNITNAVAPVPQPQHVSGTSESRATDRVDRDSRPATPSKPPLIQRGSAEPHDSFEHVPVNSGSAPAYSSDAVARNPQRGLGVLSSASQESPQPTYAAEIIDLETAVNSKGLPLVPEPEKRGALTQHILNPNLPEYAPGNIVDSVG